MNDIAISVSLPSLSELEQVGSLFVVTVHTSLVLTVVCGQEPRGTVTLPQGQYQMIVLPHPWLSYAAPWLCLCGPHQGEHVQYGTTAAYVLWLAEEAGQHVTLRSCYFPPPAVPAA